MADLRNFVSGVGIDFKRGECDVLCVSEVGGGEIPPTGHVIPRVELASSFRLLDFLQKWILDIFVTTVLESFFTTAYRLLLCNHAGFSLGRPTILFVPSNSPNSISAPSAQNEEDKEAGSKYDDEIPQTLDISYRKSRIMRSPRI